MPTQLGEHGRVRVGRGDRDTPSGKQTGGFFFFSSRRRHTRWTGDWSSDVCSSDLGRDIPGGSFCYDPWELYGRELTSPNAVVIGIVGRAKSSLVKTYVFRQAVFGRQAWIVDVKGEYDRLAEAMGIRPIALSPGGPIR